SRCWWALGASSRRTGRRGAGTPLTGRVPGASELVDSLGERRLLVGGLVLVDDALAGGLVELTRGRDQQGAGALLVARLGGGTQVTDRGTHRRLDGLVAEAVALVGAVPLDLGL